MHHCAGPIGSRHRSNVVGTFVEKRNMWLLNSPCKSNSAPEDGDAGLVGRIEHLIRRPRGSLWQAPAGGLPGRQAPLLLLHSLLRALLPLQPEACGLPHVPQLPHLPCVSPAGLQVGAQGVQSRRIPKWCFSAQTPHAFSMAVLQFAIFKVGDRLQGWPKTSISALFLAINEEEATQGGQRLRNLQGLLMHASQVTFLPYLGCDPLR